MKKIARGPNSLDSNSGSTVIDLLIFTRRAGRAGGYNISRRGLPQKLLRRERKSTSNVRGVVGETRNRAEKTAEDEIRTSYLG